MQYRKKLLEEEKRIYAKCGLIGIDTAVQKCLSFPVEYMFAHLLKG